MDSLLPRPLRRSYPGKLLIGLALVALALGAVGINLYVQVGSELEDETQTELESAAQIEAQALDEWFDRIQLQTQTIAEAEPLQSGATGESTQYLWNTVDRDDRIEAAYLVDTQNGSVITSVGSSRIVSSRGVLQASGQRDFTQSAVDGSEVIVSQPFRPYEGSAPVILLSAAVSESPHRSIVTVVDLQTLSDSQGHRSDQAHFQVHDSNRTVVMSENRNRILTESRLDSVPSAGTGFTKTTYQGEETAVGFATMETQDWTVTAHMPTNEAFALRSAILNGVLWMLLAVAAGFAVLAVVLTRSTVQPIRQLAAKTSDLRDGDLEEPIETERIDEFGDLFEAFDEMRTSLKHQIERARQSENTAQAAREQAELARRESEQLTQHLEEEAERFSKVMAACAGGELDRRLVPSSNSESMHEIADSFNEMMDDVEQQNEQLEAFTSIITHDLRNPLTVAHGRASMLKEDIDSEHIRPLIYSLDRMQTIIEDGLMLARGTQIDDPSDVDVAEHAERAWRCVEDEEAVLSLSNLGKIRADPNLLEQVFENLFRNAIEHAGQDVHVDIGVEKWGFYVEDDGPGLPEEKIDTVFEPGVSNGSGGSGLGLTIVRRIADAHGWTVDSKNGSKGARFEFYTQSPTSVIKEAGTGSMFNGDDTA